MLLILGVNLRNPGDSKYRIIERQTPSWLGAKLVRDSAYAWEAWLLKDKVNSSRS